MQPVQTVRADQVAMRSIEWLDKPFLQRSAFHLVTGPKGVGKGTWLARAATAMTIGTFGDPQNVVYVSSEDSAAVDLVPRLAAAGADRARVTIVTEHVTFPRDLSRLEALARETGDVGLIVVDPIGNHLGGADTDKEGAVRHAIGGLNQLADDLGAVVVGVRHIGKARQGGALAAVLGSVAWVDLPRAVLAFARDDEDEMVFHVQIVAGNRSGRGAAQAFRIELRPVAGLTEPVTAALPLGSSNKNVDDLLALAPRERGAKRADARDLILRELATGPKPLDELKALAAGELGVSGDTVWRAANELKAEGKARPRNSGTGTPWRWFLIGDEDALTSASDAANQHGDVTSSRASSAEVSDFGMKSEPSSSDIGSNRHVTDSAEELSWR